MGDVASLLGVVGLPGLLLVVGILFWLASTFDADLPIVGRPEWTAEHHQTARRIASVLVALAAVLFAVGLIWPSDDDPEAPTPTSTTSGTTAPPSTTSGTTIAPSTTNPTAVIPSSGCDPQAIRAAGDEEIARSGYDVVWTDEDADCLLTAYEINSRGTSPSNPDHDGDGIIDSLETGSIPSVQEQLREGFPNGIPTTVPTGNTAGGDHCEKLGNESDLTGLTLDFCSTESDLGGADATGVSAIGLEISGGTHDEAVFAGSNLGMAELWGSNFYDVDFTGASMILADIHNTDMSGSVFDGADLRGARFDEVSCRERPIVWGSIIGSPDVSSLDAECGTPALAPTSTAVTLAAGEESLLLGRVRVGIGRVGITERPVAFDVTIEESLPDHMVANSCPVNSEFGIDAGKTISMLDSTGSFAYDIHVVQVDLDD